MPKIKVTPNRVVIHVGKWWRKYRKEPEEFDAFRIQDVGRPKKSERIAVKLENGKWVTYGWSFSKDQVRYNPDTKELFVFDGKAFDIIKKLKQQGELKGIKIYFKHRKYGLLTFDEKLLLDKKGIQGVLKRRLKKVRGIEIV